jgi:2-hydroxycyclohexanecarboxyl-CoA dehydrogenase
VGIFDLDGDGGAKVVEACKGQPGHRAYQVDISDLAQVNAAVDAFEKDEGPAELLANVAGWDKPMRFLDSDPTFWDKVIKINLYGPLNLHHVVVKRFAERGFGRVVNVSSDAGRVGSSGEAVYSACKGGIAAFTKTMARELARAKVTLNVLCPGPTNTIDLPPN